MVNVKFLAQETMNVLQVKDVMRDCVSEYALQQVIAFQDNSVLIPFVSQGAPQILIAQSPKVVLKTNASVILDMYLKEEIAKI